MITYLLITLINVIVYVLCKFIYTNYVVNKEKILLSNIQLEDMTLIQLCKTLSMYNNLHTQYDYCSKYIQDIAKMSLSFYIFIDDYDIETHLYKEELLKKYLISTIKTVSHFKKNYSYEVKYTPENTLLFDFLKKRSLDINKDIYDDKSILSTFALKTVIFNSEKEIESLKQT